MKIAISAATGHFGQLAIQELLKTVAAGDIVAVVRNREKGQRYHLLVLRCAKRITRMK